MNKLLSTFTLVLCSLILQGQKNIDLKKYDDLFPQVSLQDMVISDHYTSGGITHIYFQQGVDGIPIYDSHGSIHFGMNSSNPYVADKLIPGVTKLQRTGGHSLSEIQAVEAVANAKNYPTSAEISSTNRNDKVYVVSTSISKSDIPIRKVYYLENDKLVPGYEMTIEQNSDGYFYMYLVNATTGQITKTTSLTVECNFDHGSGIEREHVHTAHCSHEHNNSTVTNSAAIMTDDSYNVYAWPVESPNHGGRTIEIEPWLDSDASPDGWHDIDGTTYTVTRGNNVDAYLDDDNTNSPTNGDSDRADGGANLSFDFPHDLNGPLIDQKDASVTNLFYWNNLIHDVMHNYGFDEASGNFQEVNSTPDGSGGDYVNAEAQDGGGSCNANMGTPAEGGNPRMQMYNCTQNGNTRDGSFDNGVIVHEYGHGISTRLTGGPASPGCLSNSEQMGEGWSDYFGLIMTMEDGDAGIDSRGIGTWLFGQSADGAGIRPYPYSTDMVVNPMTYTTISSVSVPHGVGSVWATMLWDLTWDLVDVYGFSTDLYDGDAGNNRALKLVIEGLKLQPCSPGFVDGRDAILAADEMLYGGENKCLIWEAFAERGLGYSADQGSTSSVSDGSQAFDLPPSCTVDLTITADVTEQLPGANIIYTLTSTNFTADVVNDLLLRNPVPDKTNFVSASDNGTLTNDTVVWPTFSLIPEAQNSVTLVVQVDPAETGVVEDIIDDLENGTANWTLTASGSTSWVTVSDETNSGTTAFFAQDASTAGLAEITIASPVGIGDESFLSFYHKYDTEATWDGGVVEISTDNGATWQDLGPLMNKNGYNSTIYGSNGRSGFSGDSGGWIQTVVDLSTYEGDASLIRFQMNCDAFVGGNGWWIDDIILNDLAVTIPNVASVSNIDYYTESELPNPTKITVPAGIFNVEVTSTDATCMVLGSATANAVGGSGTYTYTWSNGATTGATASDLIQGIYTVTVTDGTETQVRAFQIKGDEPLLADAYGVNVSDTGLADGSVNVEVSGGSEPYIYAWSNGQSTAEVTGLAGGLYTVTVTDNLGCSSTDVARVVDQGDCDNILYMMTLTFDQYPEETGYELYDVNGNIISKEGTFADEADGSTITRYFCLPTECFTLKVTDTYGDGICGANSNPLGSYTLTRVDINEEVATDCFTQFEGTIDFCVENIGMVLSPEILEVGCNSTTDGRINVEVSGGSGNYTYLWDTGETTSFLIDIPAGFYTITVDDGMDQVSATYEVLGSKYSRVLTTEDVISGSLRAVLANGCASDTVLFAPSLIGDPIIITDGEILISTNKTIRGLGADDIIIDGNLEQRVFNIATGAEVTIEDVTVQNGSATPDGGNILNEGTLTIKNTNINGGLDGGAGRNITNKGTLDIKEGVNFNE